MHSHSTRVNVADEELARFASLASSWWDPEGASRPLHVLNPVRLAYIAGQAPLTGTKAVDVGCGGGLLSEGLARAGADVTGIDLGQAVIDIAKLHLHESQLTVDYRLQSSAELARAAASSFDVVCCMELIEHVPDPAALVRDLAGLAKPGGKIFISTLNRTPQAFAMAILGAEYLAGLLPKGTHHYEKFLRPSEVGHLLRAAGLALSDLSGISYNPWLHQARLSRRLDVNYILCATKPEAAG